MKYTTTGFSCNIPRNSSQQRAGYISANDHTQTLGTNTATHSPEKNGLVQTGGFFQPDLVRELKEDGYKQIHRNFLLAYAFAKKNNLAYFANVVLLPNENKLFKSEILEMQEQMTQYRDCILKIS